MRRELRLRLGFWTWLFFAIMAAGAAVTVLRYWKGLGAVTNLSDKFPWGLWIGFDVLCGVALAAGGFTITTVVYVFNLKRFQPIVRPTILTAFLGYTLVGVGLMFDLGKPWNIWHATIMWNPRSPMFEVAWCVMLYLTVLSLEVCGMVFERLRWTRAAALQHTLIVPLVIAGAIISTLHQSSLGTFYLIMPAKLHPLWYTPWLPVMFWLSAVAGGLAMIIVESSISHRALGRGLDLPLLQSIGRALLVALGVYGSARLLDLANRGVLGRVFGGDREALFVQLELLIGVILPMALLSFSGVRKNSGRLYGAALLVVAGVIVNRINVSITGLEGSQGARYSPSPAEGIITIMLVAIGVAAFALAVRFLPVMQHAELPARAPLPASAAASALAPAPART